MANESSHNLLDKIVALCKRRGFIYPGSEIYGGLSGTWDYGPLGVELKNNIRDLWWKFFVRSRRDMYGVDSAILMNPKVWGASGHVGGFSDPLIECKKCKSRWRTDAIIESQLVEGEKYLCPKCRAVLGSEEDLQKQTRQFNMMFRTHVGPVEDETSVSYLRPETAQGMFVNFKNIVDSFHPKLPFGIAQIGKAFRNEIAPRDFLFRAREFEIMEFEYFFRQPETASQINADGTQIHAEKEEWEKHFGYWQSEMMRWIDSIGISKKHIHEKKLSKEELAHYSERTTDLYFDFPFGQKELYGLAYRTDFDLRNHATFSGQKLEYSDEGGEPFTPHVIEPTFGLDRTVLAVLCSAYTEDEMGGEKRVFLKLKPSVAPIKVAVFPLLKNKPELVKKAQEVYRLVCSMFHDSCFMVAFDDNGNIGKRYRRQDEIGTPFCVTIDFDSLEKGDVTVRDRDTGKQERVPIAELTSTIKQCILD